MKYVTYLRVSTQKQSSVYFQGYGIKDQRQVVKNFLKRGDEIVSEFIEVESGTKTDRPELAAAIKLCKESNATLLIARLDRLARSVLFTTSLMESGVSFICADMPEADNFTIHILASVAQKERENISRNTKHALSLVKQFGSRSGKPVGNPNLGKHPSHADEKHYYEALSNPLNKMSFAFIKELRRKKYSWKECLRQLAENEYVNIEGDPFRSVRSVQTIWFLFTAKTPRAKAAKYEKRIEAKRMKVREQVEREAKEIQELLKEVELSVI